MRLNHINLCSSDVDALRATLEQHFGFDTVAQGIVPDVPGVQSPGDAFAMLVGEDGSYVVISQIAAPDGASAYPPQFHFGMLQDSAQAVRAKHDELVAAGFTPGPISAPFDVLGATWTSFMCPLGDGLEIEVNHRTPSPILDR